MAKDVPAKVNRSQNKGRPYKTPSTSNANIIETNSISKLKAQLRQSTRLLQREKLDAAIRVETERRVDVLKSKIQAIEKSRGGADASNGNQVQAAELTERLPKKQKTTTEAEKKNKTRYKMLRHFEYKKAARRVKGIRSSIAEMQEALAKLRSAEGQDGNAKSAEKKQKKLIKSLADEEKKLHVCRVDAWYVETFPYSKRYVSLFPEGDYIESDPTLLKNPGIQTPSSLKTVEEATAAIPPAKSPDLVREYWREWVRVLLERGELVGEPVKKATKKKKAAEKNGDVEAQAQSASEDEDEESDTQTKGVSAGIDESGDEFFE